MNVKQKLAPILLIAMTLLSIRMLTEQRQEADGKYEALLSEARLAARGGVPERARRKYAEAMAMRPSLALSLEAGGADLKCGEYDAALTWYRDRMLPAFPGEPDVYAFGIRAAVSKGDLKAAFSIYEESAARGAWSEEIEGLIRPVRYAYRLVNYFDEAGPFSRASGLAPVRKDGRWGYVSESGASRIACSYRKAGEMDGCAAVSDTAGRLFLIDPGGVRIASALFLEAKNAGSPGLNKKEKTGRITEMRSPSCGLIPARDGEVWNYYDRETYEKRFGGYREVTRFGNGIAAVSADGETWMLIRTDGTPVSEERYREVASDAEGCPCRTDALFVKTGDGWILIAGSGTRLNSSVYSEVRAFLGDGAAAAKKDGRWLFVDAKGKETDLGEFADAGSFSGGLAAVCVGGKWGYINRAGEIAVAPVFDGASPVSRGGAGFVREGDRWRQIIFTGPVTDW